LTASKATFALNAPLCFFRCRFIIELQVVSW
jgi:hypothetical protein